MAPRRIWAGIASVVILALIGGSRAQDAASPPAGGSEQVVKLPAPARDSDRSLELAIRCFFSKLRRSIVFFSVTIRYLRPVSSKRWTRNPVRAKKTEKSNSVN